MSIILIHPFLANVPVSYSPKTPENLWFSSISTKYKIRTLARNGKTAPQILYSNAKIPYHWLEIKLTLLILR